MYERGLFPERSLRGENYDLAARIDEPLSQLCDVWGDRVGFVGIDNVPATQLNEYLRTDVFASTLYNRG